ncbi:acyltransferase [Photobacterium damselae]|uniref:acyltransferase n=1 Tax=Photobacterium damselae TaxID=38293 RepID=UPI003D7DCD69
MKRILYFGDVISSLLAFVIKILPKFFRHFLYDISSLIPTFLGVFFRAVILKSLLLKCGKKLYVGRFVTIKNPHLLSVGDNVSFHEYCFVDAIAGIDIGDNVSIAHSSSLISFDHQFSNEELPIKYNKLKFSEINISDDVWIGSGVRILCGSHISSRTIIAAGSVVKGNIESRYIYAGVPAKPKKRI